MTRNKLLVLAFPVALLLAGCGSNSKKAQVSTGTPATSSTAPSASTPTTAASGPNALQAEATAAATGDIPDNQIFLSLSGAGYSLKYPEGWAQAGSGSRLTIRDKNNIIRVVVTRGTLPSLGSARKQVAAAKGATITAPATALTISGAPAIHIVYDTKSAPNAVTGKTVTLGVDRYYLSKGGRLAIVDLGSPVAPVKVDNVDAYKLIIKSFRWK